MRSATSILVIAGLFTVTVLLAIGLATGGAMADDGVGHDQSAIEHADHGPMSVNWSWETGGFTDSELYINLDLEDDLDDGTEIELVANASSEEYELIGEYDDTNERIVIQRDRGEFDELIANHNEFGIEPRNYESDPAEHEVDLGTLHQLEHSAEIDGDVFHVESPLLFEDSSYVVEVRTDDWTLITEVTANRTALTLELPRLYPGEPVSVTVSDEVRDVYADQLTPGDDPGVAEIDEGNVLITDESGPGGTYFDENITFDILVEWGDPPNTTVISDVPYEDETLLFSEVGYELEAGDYLLTLSPTHTDDSFQLVVEEDGSPAVGAITTDDGFFIPLYIMLPALFILLLMTVLGAVVFRHKSGGGHQPTAQTDSQQTITIELIDEQTGDPVRQRRDITLQYGDGKEDRQTVVGGTTEFPLVDEPVTIIDPASSHQQTITQPGTHQLPVPPQRETLTVVDAIDGDNQPISGATVRYQAADLPAQTVETTEDGTFEIEIPSSVDPSTLSLEISHERYERAELTSPDSRVLELTPKTGSLVVETQIDGEAVSSVDIEVRPLDEYPTSRFQPARFRSEADGTITIPDLRTGRYTISTQFDGDYEITAATRECEIETGHTARVTLDSSLEFTLDGPTRDRIDELRSKANDLVPTSRDGAIPHYYASVLLAVLDTVERIPGRGAGVIEAGVDPAELIEATCDAVDAAIDYTREAMTTRQNVDLFSACDHLSTTRIDWADDAVDALTVDDLINLFDKSEAELRRELPFEQVDDLISDRRKELATIGPAREQFNAVRDHVRRQPGNTDPEKIAHLAVSRFMLDAVESLFNYSDLLDRLKQTTF